MKKNSDFTLFTRPGAGTFFTWIALSAAIFFSAYSVRILQMYQKEVAQNNEVLRRERELSYRLEMATVKIKDSAETLTWSNVQIEQLRKRNDDILEKSSNLRKLLYAAIKKSQQGGATDSEEISAVEPKTAGRSRWERGGQDVGPVSPKRGKYCSLSWIGIIFRMKRG